jgi:uncharacterized membrane protein
VEHADPAAERPYYTIELRPNASLSVRGAWVFFGTLCVVCFSIAGLFAAQGFWPVLAFAGLELLLLGWALWWVMRRRHLLQRISISDAQVVIDAREVSSTEHLVFPRHWAKVTLRAPHTALHPSRLLLECQGRAFEIGRFLIEEERRALAVRLQQLIGNINASPPLDGSVIEPATAR